MATAPSAAQVAALVALVKQLFATSFIGFTIATTLYGISVLQAYLYYRNYPADHWGLKITVGLLWVLDTLCTIFVAHSLYTYFVLNFGKNPTVDLIIPWSFTSEKFLVTLITFVAQCFYARTIWKISNSLILSLFVGILAVVTFALGIVTTVHLYVSVAHVCFLLELINPASFQTPLATSISARSFQILSGLVQGLAAFNDVVITVCLCAWLYRQKKGTTGRAMGQTFGTEKILDTLILYAVSRGVLTAVTQFMFLTLNLALPHATYWMPFHQAVGKLYVNSVYATLNVRHSFSEPAEPVNSKLSFMNGVDSTATGTASGTGAETSNLTGSGTMGSAPQRRLKPLLFSAGSGTGTDSLDIEHTDTQPGEKDAAAGV
ncbi:hypothetical protein B0H15DRAFT_932178 [Mycena belliarum]|uniref:DUF6534 domain-containing protein n=1 Tax=Mycena belliarum TaxID=1033014 RepID=A0AAD6XM30_9AGAR|nr:hypothetical protein B0H15DRAFT_932178 [Mycena belliae]